MLTMPSLQEVKNFVRADGNADDGLLSELIRVAEEYLRDAIGDIEGQAPYRASYLAKIVVDDMYNNRGMQDKISGATRKLVHDFLSQMRLGGAEDA